MITIKNKICVEVGFMRGIFKDLVDIMKKGQIDNEGSGVVYLKSLSKWTHSLFMCIDFLNFECQKIKLEKCLFLKINA